LGIKFVSNYTSHQCIHNFNIKICIFKHLSKLSFQKSVRHTSSCVIYWTTIQINNNVTQP
jgi:hypothetical protein